MHVECHLSVKHIAFIFVVVSLVFVRFVSAETTPLAHVASEDRFVSAERAAWNAQAAEKPAAQISPALAATACNGSANYDTDGRQLDLSRSTTFYYTREYNNTKIFDVYVANDSCLPTAVSGQTTRTLSDVEVASIGLAVSVVLLAIATICMVAATIEQQRYA